MINPLLLPLPPPNGYRIVRTGHIEPGDKMLAIHSQEWRDASGNIGQPVKNFHRIARPKTESEVADEQEAKRTNR